MQETTLTEPQTGLGLTHIGLIAGEGDFPFLIAKAARDRKIAVTGVGIRGITPPELAFEVDSMHWIDFGQLNRLIQTLHDAGVSKAVMVGRIQHRSVFQLSKIDLRGIKLLAKLPSKRADSLLGAFTEELSREQIEVLDSTMLLRECMPAPGVLTPSVPPSDAILDDIEFGRPLANQIAGMDIGQTIVVKQRAVVTVEGMEGTDLTIQRAGEIAGEGCVVIKVAKPQQDRRFDVPVLGLYTVKKMIQSRCSALAFPGGQALFFEQEEACALAASRGICIYAW